VFLIVILSNKLVLNQETHFTILLQSVNYSRAKFSIFKSLYFITSPPPLFFTSTRKYLEKVLKVEQL